jgi:hypothetical protein
MVQFVFRFVSEKISGSKPAQAPFLQLIRFSLISRFSFQFIIPIIFYRITILFYDGGKKGEWLEKNWVTTRAVL